MRITPRIARPLGTMIAYGFPEKDVARDLELALTMGASCLEILPHWRALPDPAALRRRVEDRGLTIHSAHGCWGGQSIAARRVDLGSLDRETRRASLDDIRRCIDWTPRGRRSPSGDPSRRPLRSRGAGPTVGCGPAGSLDALAEHAADRERGRSASRTCRPGVFPGSRMADLAAIVAEVDHPSVGLAIDTGHAHLVASPASETRAAGRSAADDARP